MVRKILPIQVESFQGECLQSWLMRTATVFGVTMDQLIRHFLGERKAQEVASADRLTIYADTTALTLLSQGLRAPTDTLKAMTLPTVFPSADELTIAFTGAARNIEATQEITNKRLRFGWCPLCLLEDRAGGIGSFFAA